MALDLTNAATLSGIVNQNLPAKPFLARTFFGTKLHDTLQIGVDIVSGTKKLAPFKRKGQESTVVNSGVIVTKWFGPNQIGLKIATTAFDMAKRAAGMQISYADGMKTIEERVAFKLAQDQRKLTNMIYNTIEKMCAEAIFTGKVYNYDANGNVIEDFDVDIADDHKIELTDTAKWDSQGTILENIDAWAALIANDAGIPATDVVMAPNVAAVVRTNETVLKQLAAITSVFASLNPVKPETGRQFLGYTRSGIRLWVCTESYENTAGTKTNMVPDGYVAVLSEEMAANVHYGMIEDRKAGNFVGEVFSKTWETEDPSEQWVKCASAPLAVIEQPDALVIAKVI